MKPYRVTTPLQTRGGVLSPGAVIHLPDDEAAALLADPLPAIEPAPEPAPAPEPKPAQARKPRAKRKPAE